MTTFISALSPLWSPDRGARRRAWGYATLLLLTWAGLAAFAHLVQP